MINTSSWAINWGLSGYLRSICILKSCQKHNDDDDVDDNH